MTDSEVVVGQVKCENCGMYLSVKPNADGVKAGCACTTFQIDNWNWGEQS